MVILFTSPKSQSLSKFTGRGRAFTENARGSLLWLICGMEETGFILRYFQFKFKF